MHPQQRFLHHVLGLGDAAEHPVGDGERDRPQLLEQLLPRADVATPRRQLSCTGCHPSSRLALALEAPRISVISTAPASPAASRGAGTSCFPIAPVAPATNTLISSSLIRGIIYTQYDEMTATAVTPASTPAREAVTPLHAAGLQRKARTSPAGDACATEGAPGWPGAPSVAMIFAAMGSDRGKNLRRCPSCRRLVRGSPAAAPA